MDRISFSSKLRSSNVELQIDWIEIESLPGNFPVRARSANLVGSSCQVISASSPDLAIVDERLDVLLAAVTIQTQPPIMTIPKHF